MMECRERYNRERERENHTVFLAGTIVDGLNSMRREEENAASEMKLLTLSITRVLNLGWVCYI
jgi:hypothetical protein